MPTERVVRNELSAYTTPSTIPSDSFAFSGEWMVGSEYVMPTKGSSLSFNFAASNVYLVMRPNNTKGMVKVYLDGKLVTDETKGDDVVDGVVTVDGDRLYNLIKLSSPGRHVLKIEFQDSNVEAFAFTFG